MCKLFDTVIEAGTLLLNIYTERHKCFFSFIPGFTAKARSFARQLPLKALSNEALPAIFGFFGQTRHDLFMNLVKQPREKFVRIMVIIVIEQCIHRFNFLH
jgi:hypothetical protein